MGPPPRPLPPPGYTARSSLDIAAHPKIDVFLKELKSCTRKAQPLFKSFRDERQILERVYYKGKNQHRSALFWQRLCEIRKFSARVEASALDGVLDLVSRSFFGELGLNEPKSVKGAWTHFPSAKFLIYASDRVADMHALIEKALERFLENYRWFTLSMQSGYFIQLLLMLAAMTSRLRMLLIELEPLIEDIIKSLSDVLSALHPTESHRCRLSLKTSKYPARSNLDRAERPAVPIKEQSTRENGEDIGRPLRRPRTITQPEAPTATILASDRANPSVVDDDEGETIDIHSIFSQVLHGLPSVPVLPAAPVASAPDSISEAVLQSKIQTKIVKKGYTRGASGADAERPAKKRKKKRTDDIDDIFGF